MSDPRFTTPSGDEQFYARALAVLVGPGRRVAMAMRLCNLLYWLAVVAALVWLAAQAFDRQPPVTVREARLVAPVVRPGEPVRVFYDLSRSRTCATDLVWSVYDGAGEIHNFGPLHIEAAGRPGRDSFVRAWSTPSNAAPGRSRLRVVLLFQCPGNYLQALYPVTLVLPDLAFEIAAPS